MRRRHLPEANQLFEIEAACRTGNGNAAGHLAGILENWDGDATHVGGEFEMFMHEVLTL